MKYIFNPGPFSTIIYSSSHNHGSVEKIGSWKMCGLSPNGLFSTSMTMGGRVTTLEFRVFSFKCVDLLGCRGWKLGSMVTKWVIPPIYCTPFIGRL